ncbi:MAG TPA: AI-2E family transporter [Bacilli bacterium]|nr:AI-2E family transporter [Bacilli bacterium]
MLSEFFQSKGFKRLIIILLIVFVLYSIKSMMNLILITFIFTFLIDRIEAFISSRLGKYNIRMNRKLIIAFLYVTTITVLVVGVYKYSPKIILQISQLVKQVTDFYNQPQDNEILDYIISTIKDMNLSAYIEQGVDILYKYATNISVWGIQLLLALILSLFFQLEKPRIIEFTKRFKESKAQVFYNELEYFGTRFVRSFGKVIEAQFLIALINCILSVIALSIMGFPQLLGLGLMIFLLGLIPVAGVIISLVPLCIIAFTIGGYMKVIYILVFIAILHALESYFLNPKLLSSKTDLPVFYTFIVLIFSEHFFGVWGLIIGIPIFIFLLDVLDVTEKQDESLASK